MTYPVGCIVYNTLRIFVLRVISKKKIREYSQSHTQAELPLLEWYLKMQIIQANSIKNLRDVFNSVDSVNDYTVFNIGGNKYRLIASVHYNTQLCYVRSIWTHAEYSKPYNQDKLHRGRL
jgi:mRNA interferase HigB